VARKTQFGFRLAKQAAELVVMRSVALGAGQFLRHGVVLELALFHGCLCFFVAPVQAQFTGGPRQQLRNVGIMGSVTPGAVFRCQMRLLFLPRNNDRPHFFVTLLEAKLASRNVEQILILAFMGSVTGQAFAFGNRFVGVFPGQNGLLVMALIAQLDVCRLAEVGFFFRAVRVVASHTLPLGNRVVLYVSLGPHALVTGHAQRFFGCHEFKFVIGARERQVTYRALPYFEWTVQVFVFDDFGMTLA
jgi:hypothetical protein